MRVVSLGVHILDILGAPVTEEAGPGGRHILTDVRITAAGTAAGTSVDLAKLGVDVTAMGAIGTDDLGDLLLERMRVHGIDTARVVRKAAIGTSATILPIRNDGERFATFHRPGASRHLEFEDVALNAISEADLLHIGGPDALGDFAAAALPAVLEHARTRRVPVTMDVLSWCDPRTLKRLTPALRYTDYFFPNHHQLQSMTGFDDPVDGAAAVRALGVGCVVVTRGAEGSLIATEDELIQLPAFSVPIIDTTGCGDAYTAGFIVGILKGWDMRARGLLGSACASLVGQGLGSDAGIEDLERTLAFLAQHAPVDAERVVGR
jgi:sugar/nucleoside kinase (ribokinase family)